MPMVQCRCSTRSSDLARLLVYLEPGTARSRAPWKVGVTWAIPPDDVPPTAGGLQPVLHYCRPMLLDPPKVLLKRPRGEEEGDLVARAQPSPKWLDQPLPPFPPIPNRSKPSPLHGRRWRQKTQRESLYHFSSTCRTRLLSLAPGFSHQRQQQCVPWLTPNRRSMKQR